MMWWNGVQWYWGVGMMIVFWGSIITIAYLAFRGRCMRVRRPVAREILDQRYAKGELSKEEYERRRATLESRALDRSEGTTP